MRSKIPYVKSVGTGYVSVVYPTEPPKPLLGRLVDRGWVDKYRVCQRSDGAYLIELYGDQTTDAFDLLRSQYMLRLK